MGDVVSRETCVMEDIMMWQETSCHGRRRVMGDIMM